MLASIYSSPGLGNSPPIEAILELIPSQNMELVALPIDQSDIKEIS